MGPTPTSMSTVTYMDESETFRYVSPRLLSSHSTGIDNQDVCIIDVLVSTSTLHFGVRIRHGTREELVSPPGIPSAYKLCELRSEFCVRKMWSIKIKAYILETFLPRMRPG